MESFLSLLFCKESEDEEIYTLVKDEGKSLSQFEWLSMYDEIKMEFLTRRVPLTVCELVSLMLLHEKQVFSSHNSPDSLDLHLLSGS